ncbi:MAG: low affinity iron permease family protein [Alphaproteobacteria bacterium]|nr:low affinity iron permease family protein [Alphaproteobacteria bacterium]
MATRTSNESKFSFSAASRAVATAMGSIWAFFVAFIVVVVWAVTGPMFEYSDTWQLVINTGTTIVTFLMVFLIQNTQNRDSRALHLKLDELLNAVDRARVQLIDVENCSDEEFDGLELQFKAAKKRLVKKGLAVAETDGISPVAPVADDSSVTRANGAGKSP